jgi:hypothetical protein
VVLVCADPRRIAKYQPVLVAEGFEVSAAFDADTTLDICRQSVQGVKAVVILTQGQAGHDERLVRRMSCTLPSIPCVLVPPETSAAECAVLTRIAMRCTVGSLGAA